MPQQTPQQLQLAYIYTTYRLLLTLILAVFFVITFDNPVIGADLPRLYAASILIYFVLSVVAYVLLRTIKHNRTLQLFFWLMFDIVMLTIMLHANGGPSIQLSMLYMVVVIASYMLVSPRQAMILTLFATICVIYQQFFYAFTKQLNIRGISNVTLLSISFIGTALLAHIATKRLRTMESINATQASRMHTLGTLNQRIIETMDNGVVVINNEQTILLCNNAAKRMLGLRYARPDKNISSIDLQLANQINMAIKTEKKEVLFTPTQSRIQEALSINLNHLDDETIFLLIERISRSQQQAQQLKLASLGRLTASIAHEIRNPIGAISQASQLLQEDNDENAPIYAIIHKQTKRVSQIIEDVLQMSRQGTGEPEKVNLSQFVPAFIDEHFPHANIHVHIEPNLHWIFNPSQLEQVLVNLVENGLNHGLKHIPNASLQIIGSKEDDYINLDVIDQGEGISIEDQHKLFEPFFTTASTGTGLGLYLSKAFCEANGAHLNYIPSQKGTCFRISRAV